ncbi:Gfo/Idh/MocA family oxidoreductase [Pontibacter sp. JH31]|uniref:Gfo/Idh/MocA family oxidoreductase n=1 Tax=Pontibacter aquaedesilientis TaxID=2766980 RepID=A0ABR7XEW8_9BACT|nr:Gfo/Idh/MocA family oxidoreductase [Pontibacter aquaedesilientis]MBD1396163.1 Gfo/Idh/MocA family oxidoreductase [Pontibacter aquaedesilientis]
MRTILNVGLLGFGMAGRVFHAPIITAVEGLQLRKIRAGRPESVALAQERYPQAEVVPDDQCILQDDTIDLVVVATTNSTHFSLAKAALMAGKHVIVEKPFTVTSAEASELMALAKSQNKLLTVYHNRRWDSDFRTVQKVLKSNMLGRLVEYEAHFDRFRQAPKADTWKEEATPGTSLLYDLGSHLIDQALYLFGPPHEVWADLRIQRTGSQIVDNFDVTLSYKNGLKVILKAGMLVKQPGPRFILSGEQGSFVKYGLDVQEAALKSGLSPASTVDWGVEPAEIWGRVSTEYKDLQITGTIESEAGDYRGFYQNVYNAIMGQEELVVKPEQARHTIRVIELAMQSSLEGRRLLYEEGPSLP